MSNLSESELQHIIQNVVSRLMGEAKPAAPAEVKPAPIQEGSGLPSGTSKKVVAIGSDHGGFELKEMLKPDITALGFEVMDVGTKSKDAVDYPDFAHAVAILVSQGKAWRGIIIDGAGIGSCIVANKVPGVRAGLAYDYSSAANSREHNDTNVLTLGAGLIGANLAKQIVKVWLTTEFGGGRHKPRVDKIIAIEKQYLK